MYEEVQTENGRKEVWEYMKKNYRGYVALEEAWEAFMSRSQEKLKPTEFILALVIREIEKMPKKALFIDGFPRNIDQISYSLYLRQIVNFRDDPDMLVAIDVPEAVIDARIKTRVICPVCNTSRNTKLNPTTKYGFDSAKKEYYLVCDRVGCNGGRMVRKEGDELGIEPIRNRLDIDEEVMKTALSLHGIQKVYVRNAIPVYRANELVDDYEITPEYGFVGEEGHVRLTTKPWVFKDDEGVDSVSLMAPAAFLSMLRQIAKVLP